MCQVRDSDLTNQRINSASGEDVPASLVPVPELELACQLTHYWQLKRAQAAEFKCAPHTHIHTQIQLPHSLPALWDGAHFLLIKS